MERTCRKNKKNPGSLVLGIILKTPTTPPALPSIRLTQDAEQADEYDGERPHAEPEYLLLLHELAVVAGVAGRAQAVVSLGRLPVDALPAVVAGVVQALVAVHAALAVGGHALAAGAAG